MTAKTGRPLADHELLSLLSNNKAAIARILEMAPISGAAPEPTLTSRPSDVELAATLREQVAAQIDSLLGIINAWRGLGFDVNFVLARGPENQDVLRELKITKTY